MCACVGAGARENLCSKTKGSFHTHVLVLDTITLCCYSSRFANARRKKAFRPTTGGGRRGGGEEETRRRGGGEEGRRGGGEEGAGLESSGQILIVIGLNAAEVAVY